MTDHASRWGLPPEFVPVRFPVPDDVKDVMRSVLLPNEPVVVSLSNESNTISVVATPQRLFSIKSGGVVAGVTGAHVKEFPWEGVTNLRLQQVSLNVKFAVHFKSSNGGRTCEVGQRARLAQDATENLMPFETNAGNQVFGALWQIWTHLTGGRPQPLG